MTNSILPACEAEVNPQASGVSNIPVSRPHDSTSSHPSRTSTAYAPVSQLAARDDLNGIATVLCGHWEHLRPGQALQLIVRALENCKPFVPGELGGIIDLIAHGATRVRYRRDDGKGSVAG